MEVSEIDSVAEYDRFVEGQEHLARLMRNLVTQARRVDESLCTIRVYVPLEVQSDGTVVCWRIDNRVRLMICATTAHTLEWMVSDRRGTTLAGCQSRCRSNRCKDEHLAHA